MFQEFIDRVMQAFAPPPKTPQAKAAAGKERRKGKRAGGKDRRKSSMRLQDWNERDKKRSKLGEFHWEGYL